MEAKTVQFDVDRIKFALGALTSEYDYGGEWEPTDAIPKRLGEDPNNILATLVCNNVNPRATVYLQVCRDGVKLFAHYEERKLVHYFAHEPSNSAQEERDVVAEAKAIYEHWRCPAKRKLFALDEDDEEIATHRNVIVELLKGESDAIMEMVKIQKTHLEALLRAFIGEEKKKKMGAKRNRTIQESEESAPSQDQDQAVVEALRRFIDYTSKILQIAKSADQVLTMHTIIGEVMGTVVASL